MMEEKQECIDHRMWKRNFSWAYWAFFLASIITAIMHRPFELSLSYFGLSFLMLICEVVSDIRHMEWHRKNDKEGGGYNFRQ